MTASFSPKKAIVLAAGLGLRMRPITEKMPKPLIKIAGKPLLDWGLDALARAGVDEAVVNVHHLPDQIRSHISGRAAPRIVISDETEQLLDSAGGIIKALPTLGASPFFLVNADTFWIDGPDPDLSRLALAWDAGKMDMLLMLADPNSAVGHTGKTDFLLADDGTLSRSGGDENGLIYAGAAIIDAAIFAGANVIPQSLNRYFDIAIGKSRLHGMKMKGQWITVGTPDAIPAAEEAVAKASRQ
ncbi:MAG TPA: nucleotidyltransferase family protein [Rhizobiaceae bacterium]|nr:nucleotidyltransferase family protein [Rhizobiaceae bacterium]